MQVLQSHNQYTESVKISPAGSGRSADVLLVTTNMCKNTSGGTLQQVHSFATKQQWGWLSGNMMADGWVPGVF